MFRRPMLGLPAGCIDLLLGNPAEVWAQMFASPVARAVLFTGSSVVGKKLMGLAAPGLKRPTAIHEYLAQKLVKTEL